MAEQVYFDSEIDPETGDMRMILRTGPSPFKLPQPDTEAPANNDPTSVVFYEPKEEVDDDAKKG